MSAEHRLMEALATYVAEQENKRPFVRVGWTMSEQSTPYPLSFVANEIKESMERHAPKQAAKFDVPVFIQLDKCPHCGGPPTCSGAKSNDFCDAQPAVSP
jgi:NMD protein affecting ribosome stability and mRNA decay